MNLDEWNFPTDEEIADSRGKKDQDRIFITNLRPDVPQVYYFLTLPGQTNTDWVNYRELSTRDGLKVGPELPNSLSFGVPVRDFRMVDNPITGKRVREIDNNLDPLTAGKPGHQMWQTGPKNLDKNGLVMVRDRCAVNVIDGVTGWHKILKISLMAKEQLVSYFETAVAVTQEHGGTFDVQGRPYEILWTGEGYQWKVAMRAVRPGSSVIRDNKAVDVIPLEDPHPQPLDVRQIIKEQREEMDAWLASLPTRSGNPVDTSLEAPIEDAPDFVKERADDTTDLPGGLDLFAGKDQSLTEKYLAMSPARLRAMHAKAGIDVDRGVSKPELAASAAKHNL